MESIVVDDNNPEFDSRQNCNAIIEKMSNKLVCGCAFTVIPKSVTEIGYNAFYGSDIENVIIPQDIIEISGNPFANCNIKSIVVDKNNTMFDSRQNCNAIIRTETDELISGCANTIIPNGIKEIRNSAFEGVDGLQKLTLPLSVVKIHREAFKNCKNLHTAILSKTIKLISYDAFEGCSSLVSLHLPDYLDIIYDGVFRKCTSLKEVVFPTTVKKIGKQAFQGCTSLSKATITNGIKKIEQEAFEGCTSLTSITIPSTIEELGGNCFGNCSSLRSIVVHPANVYYDSRENCNAIIQTKYNRLIRGCSTTIIPSSVKNIVSGAFSGCVDPREKTSVVSNTQPQLPKKSLGEVWKSISGTYMFSNGTLTIGITSFGETSYAIINEIEYPMSINDETGEIRVFAKDKKLVFSGYLYNGGNTIAGSYLDRDIKLESMYGN